MLTREQRRLCRNAYKQLGWLDESIECLVDDPMTAAMGAPVGDFIEDWERKQRAQLSEYLRNPLLPECMRVVIWQYMERWMP